MNRLKTVFLMMFIILMLPLLARCGQSTVRGDSAEAVRPNILIIQSLVAQAAQRVIREANLVKGTVIRLWVQPAEDRWIVEQAVSSAFLEAGCTVGRDSGEAGSLRVDVRPVGLKVSYGGIYRSVLFGPKRTVRSVVCSLAFEVIENRTGNIRLSKTLTEQMNDTVDVDMIQSLEDPAVKNSRGEIPEDGILDRIAEPLVVLGATGIIIYLFFHIRS